MVPHIGEKIKIRAKELRIGPTELADMINTSKQNVYGIYKRKTLDSELLRQISLALNFDFFSTYYDKQWQKNFQESQVPYQTKAATVLKDELTKLKKEHQDLQEKYEMLKKLYEFTDEKLRNKKEGVPASTPKPPKAVRKTK
jgi:septin family protein